MSEIYCGIIKGLAYDFILGGDFQESIKLIKDYGNRTLYIIKNFKDLYEKNKKENDRKKEWDKGQRVSSDPNNNGSRGHVCLLQNAFNVVNTRDDPQNKREVIEAQPKFPDMSALSDRNAPPMTPNHQIKVKSGPKSVKGEHSRHDRLFNGNFPSGVVNLIGRVNLNHINPSPGQPSLKPSNIADHRNETAKGLSF